MANNPIIDVCQPVLQGSGIQKTARGVTQVKSAVLIVNLCLKKTQASVQSIRGVEELVTGDGVAGARVSEKGAIMGSHVGNVVVMAVT